VAEPALSPASLLESDSEDDGPDDGPLDILPIDLTLPCEVRPHPRFDRPLEVTLRQAALLTSAPWVRPGGRVRMEVSTQGWRFPIPPDQPLAAPPRQPNPIRNVPSRPVVAVPNPTALSPFTPPQAPEIPQTSEIPPAGPEAEKTHLRPPQDTVLFKDRLLYLLQPPLEDLFAGEKVSLPFKPYPYQVKGISFLMPRHHALIADEMGLGKTVQVIVALRLLLHAGLIRQALVICPKPLVINWTREMRTWAPDVPFEVIGGDTEQRRSQWKVSNCPVKLVNYELLTRDAADATDESVRYDVVVLDEAQRIKSRDSRTAQVVNALHRDRSWAMTGTPIENRIEDLINIFNFVAPGCIPPETSPRQLAALTSDYILRRTKEMVVSDMPPRIIRDVEIELSPAQHEAYELAEKEGIIHLNALGETITVQHVFELVMRLKQICNFDPRTGQSAKLEQILADMQEVAENGRKAIIFSQWVEPLEQLANHLAPYGPLLYHGKVPHRLRQPILDRFKNDPSKHVILMSYGTGSVGLNLQFTNYVFLFDRWWNPAIEDQAINRAHRLGQKSAVFVNRYITQDTIERRIADVLDKKRQLFTDVIEQNGPPATLGLTEDEVFGLFHIQARPRRG
jgi:SNF2 family DNA or RNA helicase